jgi:hypothetical protein
LEGGDGVPFIFGKDKNEILVKGLSTPKAGEDLNKFEE